MPVITDVKELLAESKKASDKVEAIYKEFEGEEIPDEKSAEIDTLLEKAEEYQLEADRRSRASELKSFHNDPVRSRRTQAAGTQTKTEVGDADSPFQSLGEQLDAVYKSSGPGVKTDERLMQIKAATGLNESIPSDGGFLVQRNFTEELFRLAHESGQLASRCSVINIGPGKNGTKINALVENSRADGSRWGGVRGYWANEGASLTTSKPTFRQMELSLNKLTAVVYATEENLEDAVMLESLVREIVPDELAFKLDDAIFRGDGAGKPKGFAIAANASFISVAKETAQTASTVLAENIEKMWARMFSRSLMNAVWFVNQDVWPQLFQLNHVVGTGGIPMFILPGGLKDAPFGALLGRPIVPIEHCATLGSLGDIVFADMKQYALARKKGVRSAVSMHVAFLTDEQVFKFVLRVDGQSKWSTALTPFQGSNTQSPFVGLAARA